MNNKETIIQQIQEVFKNIATAGETGNTEGLLTGANQLSTLRYNLGEMASNAKDDYERANAEYKSAIDKAFLIYRGTEMAIDEAKARARQDFHVDLVAILAKDKEKTQLYMLRDDIAIKISNLQSYASDLRSMRSTREY